MIKEIYFFKIIFKINLLISLDIVNHNQILSAYLFYYNGDGKIKNARANIIIFILLVHELIEKILLFR